MQCGGNGLSYGRMEGLCIDNMMIYIIVDYILTSMLGGSTPTLIFSIHVAKSLCFPPKYYPPLYELARQRPALSSRTHALPTPTTQHQHKTIIDVAE